MDFDCCVMKIFLFTLGSTLDSNHHCYWWILIAVLVNLLFILLLFFFFAFDLFYIAVYLSIIILFLIGEF